MASVVIDENGTINSPHWQLGNNSLTFYSTHHAGKLTDDELVELLEVLSEWKVTHE